MRNNKLAIALIAAIVIVVIAAVAVYLLPKRQEPVPPVLVSSSEPVQEPASSEPEPVVEPEPETAPPMEDIYGGNDEVVSDPGTPESQPDEPISAPEVVTDPVVEPPVTEPVVTPPAPPTQSYSGVGADVDPNGAPEGYAYVPGFGYVEQRPGGTQESAPRTTPPDGFDPNASYGHF